MPVRYAIVLLALLTAPSAVLISRSAQDPPQREQQPIRTGATLVRVDVYPTRGGRPLHGLTAADFEVLEDGVLQKIDAFEHVAISPDPLPTDVRDPSSQREMLAAAANPRTRVFVLFMDVNHVGIAGSHNILEPTIKLIQRLVGRDDLIGLMTPDMSATEVILARKSLIVEEMLRRNWEWGKAGENIPRLTEREMMYTLCYPSKGPGLLSPLAAAMIAKSRQRVTLESLQDLVKYLGAVREERKAIVAVSQGWKLMGPNPELMNLQDKGTEPIPGREPVTVGPNGKLRVGEWRSGSGDVSKTECEADRMRLAQMDNERFFRELLDDANRANAAFYPIDPRGLVAPAGGLPWDNGPTDRLMELASNTDGLALVNSNDLDKAVTRIVDDLSSYYLIGYNSTNTKADGRFRRIQVRVKQSGVEVRARRGYRAPAATELTTAAPGAAPAAPTVPAAFTAALGALARIPSDTSDGPASRIAADPSQPAVFRRGSSTGSRFVPAAIPRFSRTEHVRVEVPIDAAAAPAAQLLDRTGKLLQVPVTLGERTDPASGRRWITADLTLAPLAAGDYVIEISPQGAPKVFTAIRVTR